MDAARPHRSRAQRFDVAVPAKLCSQADPHGQPALTKNISGSGALLLESRELPVGAELDIWLLMRQVRSSLADVVCPSVVVRCDGGETKGIYRVGVKFKGYEFQRVHQESRPGGGRRDERL